MSTNDWSVVASVLGFLGSMMLFYPGWRVSRGLKTIEHLRAVVNTQTNVVAAADELQDRENDHFATIEQATEGKAGDYDPGPEYIQFYENKFDIKIAKSH